MREGLLEYHEHQGQVVPDVSFRNLLRDEMALCSDAQLSTAQQMADVTGVTLDQVLAQTGIVTQTQRRDALSRHHDIAGISLESSQPDATLCDGLDYKLCLHLGFVPWQQLGQTIILAIDGAERIDAVLQTAHQWWPDLRVGLVLATQHDVSSAIETAFSAQIAQQALRDCPDRYSCRNWGEGRGIPIAAAMGLGVLVAAFLAPIATLTVILSWILCANTATLGLRLTAVLSMRWRRDAAPLQQDREPQIWPTISILLPVLREEAVIGQLIRAMERLDYPRAALDVMLLLEENDEITRHTLSKITLPPFLRVIEVPEGELKTKPRAMNYALPFCRGSIIGIYDAEDRPEPDQLRKVAARLNSTSWHVGCVQARLDFYNPDQNWLTRCFTLEYATWFRVLLHGIQVLRLPLPLGGTSVFFRRPVLEEIGAWDAHNVTEDAELGMRLARYGFHCEMITSTTFEEANSNYRNWIGQRSRWLKGYFITWAAHMRSPVSLLRDLGIGSFLGFQVLFLGAITAYLAIPLFWLMTGMAVTGTAPLLLNGVPEWLWSALWISLPVGQIVMLAAVALAMRDRNDMRRVLWAFTLPAYWPLGAMAAWRAVVELFVAPFHWHKTQHGLSDISDEDDPAA